MLQKLYVSLDNHATDFRIAGATLGHHTDLPITAEIATF
jgi:hypothetical protein